MIDATRVAIIGLGAIGGSIALKLVELGARPNGYTADEDDRRRAAAAGVRIGSSIENAVADSDVVLLAVPLDQLAGVARKVVSGTRPTTTILHAASLQRSAATAFDESLSERIVGTHPIAGTAQRGFSAARADLFHGATVYVDVARDRRRHEDPELFWSMAGAERIEYLPANEHDDLMAAISHLPQLLSTALAATLEYEGIESRQLGPGAKDMTRLAGSSWSMWRPLLAATPERTLALLDSLVSDLQGMRDGLAAGTLRDIEETWAVARTLRRDDLPPQSTNVR